MNTTPTLDDTRRALSDITLAIILITSRRGIRPRTDILRLAHLRRRKAELTLTLRRLTARHEALHHV